MTPRLKEYFEKKILTDIQKEFLWRLLISEQSCDDVYLNGADKQSYGRVQVSLAREKSGSALRNPELLRRYDLRYLPSLASTP